MSVLLPPAVGRTFIVAAAERGFASAARFLVRDTAQSLGREGVEALRRELGRRFPMLDAAAAHWLDGEPAPRPDGAAVREAVEDLDSLLVVGVEADPLNALGPLRDGLRTGILAHRSVGPVEVERLVANLPNTWEFVFLNDVHLWARGRVGVLTFAYGSADGALQVCPEYARVVRDDTRRRFHTRIAWDLLPASLAAFPRWLTQVPRQSFTHVCE